jgi:hypothetical protein
MSRPDETKYRMVRLPVALAEELDREADAMLAAYQGGRRDLPGEYCARIPIHYVISSMLADCRAKRERSRAPKRPRASKVT